MYCKINISGKLTVKTGMHIGGDDGFAAIGAIDSPVIRDAVSNKPYIPGSSLKGKMRSLLRKQLNANKAKKPDDDDIRIMRLFGASKVKTDGEKDKAKVSRLLFSDTIISNSDSLGVNLTEGKMENTIDLITAIANPRQIERVVRGAEFPITIIYNVENEDEILEDFENIALGIKLLQYDYLGGNGSRGYGRVNISELNAECVVGDLDEKIVDECNKKLEGVNDINNDEL